MLMIPITTHVTKEAPPSTVLRPTSHVPSPIKDMLEKKSGAPLPRESRVTQHELITFFNAYIIII